MTVYINYRGVIVLSPEGSMLFPLLLQGPGIEPYKSALKLDTLATDPLGRIYTRDEISRSDKTFEESHDSCLWTKPFFHAAALFDILFNYRGNANGIVISLKCPL